MVHSYILNRRWNYFAPQVRNLRSCVKVAVDFVSPESIGECLAMAHQLRRCPQDLKLPAQDRFYAEKLQGRLMVMTAAVATYRALQRS